jgi:hypothetical protein
MVRAIDPIRETASYAGANPSYSLAIWTWSPAAMKTVARAGFEPASPPGWMRFSEVL